MFPVRTATAEEGALSLHIPFVFPSDSQKSMADGRNSGRRVAIQKKVDDIIKRKKTKSKRKVSNFMSRKEKGKEKKVGEQRRCCNNQREVLQSL